MLSNDTLKKKKKKKETKKMRDRAPYADRCHHMMSSAHLQSLIYATEFHSCFILNKFIQASSFHGRHIDSI